MKKLHKQDDDFDDGVFTESDGEPKPTKIPKIIKTKTKQNSD